MIEENLYVIELSGYTFNVIANSFAEAEKIALEVISIRDKYRGQHIYDIHKNGCVFRPKTKTITVEL